MTAQAPAGLGQRKDQFIQIWRAIAVVIVVYYHFSNRIPPEYLNMSEGPTVLFYSGKLGVLIFFIISGYLITKSLMHSQNLARFYAKRISRIWPLFILASLVLFTFIQFVEPPIVSDGPKKFYTEPRDWSDLAGSLFFLEDLGFQWMDGVFWSILVELKYYFWIGLLAFWRPVTFVRDFAVLAIIISVAEMLFGLSGAEAFRNLPTVLNGFFIAQYLPYFAIGALLLTCKDREILSILLIIALLQAGLKSSANADFDMRHTIIFGLALIALLSFDIFVFRSKVFLHIGKYSYGFYLFHQLIGLSIIKALADSLSYDLALIIALASTYAISVAASWVAEWRFRQVFHTALMRIFIALKIDRLHFGKRAT